MSKSRLYILLLTLGTAFWGISFSLVKVGIEDGSPFVFLAWRFALAAVVLALIFARRLHRLNRATALAGVLIALPLFFGIVFQTIGLQHTSVTNSAFITGLSVLLIPLIKWRLFGRAVAGRIWLCCAMALAGLYLIVAQNGLHLNAGDLWTMACALFFSSFVLVVGYFAHRHDPVLMMIVAMACCCLGCLFAASLDPRAIWTPAGSAFWIGVLFTALPGTAYMYAIQSAAQRYVTEEKVALTYLCEPVFAALAGVVLLGEAMSPRTIAGAGMIFLAMLLAEVDVRHLWRRSVAG